MEKIKRLKEKLDYLRKTIIDKREEETFVFKKTIKKCYKKPREYFAICSLSFILFPATLFEI